MTAESLIHAAVRVLLGQQGERAEWFAALCDQPLRCLLALRRMQRAHPDAFEQLTMHPTSGTQLRYASSRAQLDRRRSAGCRSTSRRRCCSG